MSAAQPPTDPPKFSKCVAQVRKQIPALAKQKDKQLRSDCNQLFTSLSGQVMDFLIRAYWYQADAEKAHVKVTDAQVQQAFQTAKKQQFSTDTAFQSFLNDLGFIWADHDMKFDEAEKLIRKAIDKDREQRKKIEDLPKDEDVDNPAYLDSLGWVLFKKKDFKEAKKYLLQAVQDKEGQHIEILDHLADTHLNPLITATVEATEEAILNALTMATTVVGRDGHRVEAISLTRLRAILDHQAK